MYRDYLEILSLYGFDLLNLKTLSPSGPWNAFSITQIFSINDFDARSLASKSAITGQMPNCSKFAHFYHNKSYSKAKDKHLSTILLESSIAVS